MRRATILSSVGLAVAILFSAACGGGGDDENEITGTTCESNCERRMAAQCSQYPANYRTTCEANCADAKTQVGEACQDQLAAAHACVATKVKFSCDSRGFLVSSPAPGAACADQAAACTACSQDVIVCNRL